jgi:hypothetical protein
MHFASYLFTGMVTANAWAAAGCGWLWASSRAGVDFFFYLLLSFFYCVLENAQSQELCHVPD